MWINSRLQFRHGARRSRSPTTVLLLNAGHDIVFHLHQNRGSLMISANNPVRAKNIVFALIGLMVLYVLYTTKLFVERRGSSMAPLRLVQVVAASSWSCGRLCAVPGPTTVLRTASGT